MRAFSRRLLPVVLALALGACTAWARQPTPRPGQDSLAGPVRVFRVDSSALRLYHVTITADSVVGWERAGVRRAIDIAEVTRVEARRADPVGTVMLVFVPVLTAVVLWASYKAGAIGTKY
ncbi:MAG: hypothetical protein ACJ8GN_30275 [Longimicrobiaceae bacterium]